jgi:hypothetical protein
MRRVLWVGLLGCGLVLSACAGPGERPTKADMIFPIPWVFKQQQARPTLPAENSSALERPPAGRP